MPSIVIHLASQTLDLHGDDDAVIRRYRVSTARNGAGELRGSLCTPRGRHVVRARIGAGQPLGTVFRGRRPTGEIWTPELAASQPDRDWILTRILWLSGCEPGVNRLGEVDTMRRYIYIHGTADDAPMGVPRSIGCIRMRNRDVAELFELVAAGTPVDIRDDGEQFSICLLDWAAAQPLAAPVRLQVFVEEQGVPVEMEWDDMDASSLHVLALDRAGRAIGTGRLLPSEEGESHLGRIAVVASWRRQGVGGAMLRALMEAAAHRGDHCVLLHAQVSAIDFYRGFGFSAVGGCYMEAGIRHQTMRCELSLNP